MVEMRAGCSRCTGLMRSYLGCRGSKFPESQGGGACSPTASDYPRHTVRCSFHRRLVSASAAALPSRLLRGAGWLLGRLAARSTGSL